MFPILSFFVNSQLFAGTEPENFNQAKRNAEAVFTKLQEESATKTTVKPAAADNDLFPMAVLKGEGSGKDEETAKKSALSELSKSIVVTVSAQFVSVSEKKNGEYYRSLRNDVVSRSDTFLKGVRFTKPQKTKHGISLTAFMTEKDIINTISYLLKTIPSDIETLAPEKFDDVFTSIFFAYSLLYAVSDSEVKEREKYIKILDSLKNETEKLATSGSVYFSAKTGISGKVEIAGTKYDLNQKIHLKPGNYNFSVKSDGYKNISGKFTIAKGDRKFVEPIFVPENQGKKEIYLRVESPVGTIDEIEKTLLDFGIVATRNKNLPHQIAVFLKGKSTKVDNYEKYTLKVDIHTFKNGQKFKITHYENKPFFVTPQNKNEKISEESRKVSVTVIKKFLSSIDLGEFFAN